MTMGAIGVARTITTALLAGALALAACGGSDDSDDSPTRTASSTQADKPTRAEYVRDLDALCKRTDEESADAERRFDAAADRDDNDGMVNALDEILDQQDEWMGDLDAIAVPSSERDFHKKYREGVERGFTLSGLLRDAIEANDLGDVTTYADEIRDSSKQRDALLDGHGGFEHCGSDDRR